MEDARREDGGGSARIDAVRGRVHPLAMKTLAFTYWQDGDAWLGHLEEFPDYLTQGESLDDLKEHLLDLYRDLTSGEIPCVRRHAELEVA